MKQPVAAGIIEFPLKLIMANKCNILITVAIVFLASLSSSSAFIKRNVDISEGFDNHFELPLREKRHEDVRDPFFATEHDPLKLEELSELQTVYDKRTIEEEVKEINQKDDRKNEERSSTSKTFSNTEEDAQSNTFSYKNVHDLMQALILLDEIDIAEKLQHLREIENATESEPLSKLPKRHAGASAAAAAAAAVSNDLLGGNLWDVIPVDDLDAHSCEMEAFEHSHLHLSGTITHEFACELRKIWHYGLIIGRNFKSGLTLGPLITGEVVGGGFFHHIKHILHTILRQPHHLLILPDIIRDAIPFPSISGAIFRFKHALFKVTHFVRHLFYNHMRHALGHFFLHHHLGVFLREKLLEIELAKLHYLHGLSSILPEYFPVGGIITHPGISTVTSAATATATASSNAAAFVPDYYGSLEEVLNSFRGVYDGYYASGLPRLINAGVRSFSTSSVFSWITSRLSKISFFNYFGRLFEQDTTITTASASSASASVSVESPTVGPAIEPAVAPIVPLESDVTSSSASAAATATTTVTETKPLISVVPTVIPSVPIASYDSMPPVSSNVAATATASAAAVASPVAPSYQIAPPVYLPTVTPLSATNTVSTSSAVSTSNAVVEETAVPYAPLVQPVLSSVIAPVEDSVSESSSVAVATNVAVATPEVAVATPEVGIADNVGSTVVTSASASASATSSSAADVVSSPTIASMPILSYPRYRPIYLPAPAPAAASAAASSSASVSSGGLIPSNHYRGLDLDIDRLRYPLIYPQTFPAWTPSAGVSSAAAASASASGSGSSAASAASASGLNFVLPRHQIINALGHDYLLPGDIITITLRNKAILFSRILDATSPITFHFLRPKLRASLFRHGGRVWNLLPRDFRDPECAKMFNNPLLLRYAL